MTNSNTATGPYEDVWGLYTYKKKGRECKGIIQKNDDNGSNYLEGNKERFNTEDGKLSYYLFFSMAPSSLGSRRTCKGQEKEAGQKEIAADRISR